MTRTAALIIILIVAALLAGCTSTPSGGGDIAGRTTGVHFEYRTGWSPGLGCYEKVSGYAFNAGNATVDDVRLNFNLVDSETGTIRDSRSVFLGTLKAGASRTFESDLDGECLPDYRVEGTILR